MKFYTIYSMGQRTPKYVNANPLLKEKIDTILSLLNGMGIDEAKDILRIASNEVYSANTESKPILKFT